MNKNAVEETKELSIYLAGFAAGRSDENLKKAAEWLEELSDHVCGQGYIGCDGGVECDSDHK